MDAWFGSGRRHGIHAFEDSKEVLCVFLYGFRFQHDGVGGFRCFSLARWIQKMDTGGGWNSDKEPHSDELKERAPILRSKKRQSWAHRSLLNQQNKPNMP